MLISKNPDPEPGGLSAFADACRTASTFAKASVDKTADVPVIWSVEPRF